MKTKSNKMSYIEHETAHGSKILAYTRVSYLYIYSTYVYNIYFLNFLTLFKVHKFI